MSPIWAVLPVEEVLLVCKSALLVPPQEYEMRGISLVCPGYTESPVTLRSPPENLRCMENAMNMRSFNWKVRNERFSDRRQCSDRIIAETADKSPAGLVLKRL